VIDKDSAVELYAGFGKSVYTAFATIGGNAVGVVATGKQLCHNCVAKASRFVRLCDAFSVPVVTIVDTEGFVPSVTDDVAGGIREAARLAATYADATTAKVAVLAGKAVGPVYTTLAAADLRIAVTGCTVSALEPSAPARRKKKGDPQTGQRGRLFAAGISIAACFSCASRLETAV